MNYGKQEVTALDFARADDPGQAHKALLITIAGIAASMKTRVKE